MGTTTTQKKSPPTHQSTQQKDSQTYIAIVISKSTPLGSCVNDAITEHKSTIATYQITRSEFFNDIRRNLSAIRTNDFDVQVGHWLWRLRGGILWLRISQWEGNSRCHGDGALCVRGEEGGERGWDKTGLKSTERKVGQ
jgi:hypothetical protein